MAKTVMIVDDKKDIRNTTKTALEKKGNYEVIPAVNADECLEKLERMEGDPDLILMDIMMPGTPVKEIIPKIENTKICYLSVVRTSEAEKEELLEQENVIGFIEKPFGVNELVKKTEEMIG